MDVDIYFYSGGYARNALNDILEFDPETKKWTQIGTMREVRWAHAVSVVKYEDYLDFCH